MRFKVGDKVIITTKNWLRPEEYKQKWEGKLGVVISCGHSFRVRLSNCPTLEVFFPSSSLLPVSRQLMMFEI